MASGDSPDYLSRSTLIRLRRLADIMDRAFTIPGTTIRFGVDPLLGLVPVVGDTLTVVVSAYIYSFAKTAGVSRHNRMRMLWNIFIDWFIGLIPLVGDIFDVRFKANSRNMRIIIEHVESQANAEPINRDDEPTV